MKVAIVTGAGRGIGRSIATALSKDGYSLVLNYRSNVTELEQFVSEIGADAILVKGDIRNFEDAEELVKSAVTHYGRLDLLVNNAGITKDTLLLRMSEDDFDTVTSTNLKGTFNCTKHAAKVMFKQRSGAIVNISSVVGITGNIGQSNYAASKAGVIGFTKAVARELAPRGVRVNAVAPGFIATQMTDVIHEDIKKATLSNIPMGKFGEAEDVANLVLFLASEKAKYITGQVVQVDGGMAM
ncbi:3-oxoacyl-[acyl-carrier-protein] reductase [Fusibacter bizertensis]|jgi:3-oxoacyl-[acyl-carrier-protein] reductase (EC 1.1.1.100)|uniref:3-oxoacyl-[acyl-carrier-protein] reductase n=1 Tax=Fusibacter bizertensis TaxID=1488331 RepID=A0ABT6NBW0_9FIRM|nr:3-oxoacyl-[acyl-carrier-protein] reductase [Fusibacter bizertensis]MDH8677915.1 3-oxoacyl-[acyl-carrier-protein] reductase [Fusibacter bizertensis]